MRIWSETYDIILIVDYLFENQLIIKDCYDLAPVIKSLRDIADVLNAFLLIMKTKEV